MQKVSSLSKLYDQKIHTILPGLFRGLCSAPSNATINDPDSEVLVEGKANSRTAVLNRPNALNALSTTMGAKLQHLYKCWEADPNVGFVALKGAGRAFCAGGDIICLYHLINQGDLENCKDFFRNVYTFIYLLGTYLKPHVAILDGITMGGGAGISIPGTFRIATNNTVFATPETSIGFHPDAGASFFLSRLPGYLGEYLGLTGEKISGAEMVACGLATHYSLGKKVPLIEEQLGKLVTDDPSVLEASLEQFGESICPSKMSALQRIITVNKCFGHDTVEEIIDALEKEAGQTGDPWCTNSLSKLKAASPLGLKVALRSIRMGRFQSLDQCLVREYRMSLQGISCRISSDFREGVRARMVDRDFAARWNPSGLKGVSEDMVDEYFSPLTQSEPDLELPTKLREAFS